jgi:flagellin
MAVKNSIITNPGAFTALRTLNSINRGLDTVQNRVSTGLKALDAVSQGLNNSKGVGNTAIAGATGVSDLLTDLRAKLTELSNEGITTVQRAILTDDFNALVSQAANFVANATFNGIALLTGSTNVNTLSNLSGGSLSLTAQTNVGVQIRSIALATIGTATNAQSIIANEFGNLEAVVNTALGTLGAEVRALDLQTQFLEKIRDATDEGLGNIVDADLARESARLTSLQVQQQLSVQTLGLANQRPQSLLGLFR